MNYPTYKFYCDKTFKIILELVEAKKYNKALSWYNQYFEKYPNDFFGHVCYADLLIKLGRFDEASEIIYDQENNLREESLRDYNIIKMKLLCCLQKYKEAYDLILENISYFDNQRNEILFLKKQLGLLDEDDYKLDSYSALQILDYSEERFYNHIQNHLYQGQNDETSQFNQNFPIKEVVEQIKKLLPYHDKIYNSPITSLSLFKYNNNGTSIEKIPVDYIEVVTINEQNNILTMYPYLNTERRDAFDITPVDFDDNNKPIIKRLTQIEKFNQKYSK